MWTSSLCQQGLGRDNIEDCVFVRNNTHERYAILGVSDGMGGLEVGEIASAKVCKAFNVQIVENPEQELICRAEKINSVLYNQSERTGATISVIVIDKKENMFFALSIGDSRIYRYRKFKLVQLSVDDKSPLQGYNLANVITNAIGIKASLDNFDIISGKTEKGDSWLLSTDGIHSLLSAGNIKEIIQLFDKHYVVGELAKQAINRRSEDDLATIFCSIR